MAYKSNSKKKKLIPVFSTSEETTQSLLSLGVVLRKILNRLITEGKAKIKNGKVIFIKKG